MTHPHILNGSARGFVRVGMTEEFQQRRASIVAEAAFASQVLEQHRVLRGYAGELKLDHLHSEAHRICGEQLKRLEHLESDLRQLTEAAGI